MSKIDTKSIEQYQLILQKDPASKVFAALAESYREMKMVQEAEDLLRRGISRHPQYAPGYVVLGRLLLDLKRYEEAKLYLKKATSLSSENILAYQLLGQVFIEQKNPKEALKAHKMVLFLNPMNEKSRSVVQKLENLTADEYEEEMFEMKPLKGVRMEPLATTKSNQMDRSISLIDALIVRNDIEKAREHLAAAYKKNPGNPELKKRLDMILADSEEDEAEIIRPIAGRQKLIINRKIKTLNNFLVLLKKQREMHS